jgi:hypothetical protein
VSNPRAPPARRLSTESSPFAAIRTIKFFGWSTAWSEKVDLKRQEELSSMIQGRHRLADCSGKTCADPPNLRRMAQPVSRYAPLHAHFGRGATRLLRLLRQGAG